MRPILRLILMLRRALLVALVALLFLGASPAAAGRRKVVVASFYPLAWAAKEVVGGSEVKVTDLTPPGSEPHDLELTTDDRDAIEDADLVIVLGGGFQPAVEEAAKQRDGRTLVVVDELPRADRRHAKRDPHFWLDPSTLQKAGNLVAQELRRGGAPRLDEELGALDEEYRDGLARCERDLIVTAHDAFGWLARAYGLRQEAIAGIDPESEPSPKRLAHLADLVEREGVTTVFTE